METLSRIEAWAGKLAAVYGIARVSVREFEGAVALDGLHPDLGHHAAGIGRRLGLSVLYDPTRGQLAFLAGAAVYEVRDQREADRVRLLHAADPRASVGFPASFPPSPSCA